MGIEQFLSSRNTCTHSFVIKHQHYSVQRQEQYKNPLITRKPLVIINMEKSL
jgi:hypothetical protein